MSSALRSALPIWLVGMFGGIAALVFAYPEALVWLPVVLAGSILLTFVAQLVRKSPEGFIGQIGLSVAGLFLIFATLTLIRLSFAGIWAASTIVG